MSYQIIFTREACKDVKKLTPRLRTKLREILENDLAVSPESGKRLVGDLQALFSLRLNYQDRIVYSLDKKTRTITVHRVRTHYGE